MASLEAVRAARAAVRAKLDSEGLEIISVGIQNTEDDVALKVGVAHVRGGGKIRRQHRLRGEIGVVHPPAKVVQPMRQPRRAQEAADAVRQKEQAEANERRAVSNLSKANATSQFLQDVITS